MAVKKAKAQSLRERMLAGRAQRNEKLREIRLDDFSADIGEDFIAKVRRFELGERAVYYGAPESMSKRISARTKDYARIMSKHNMPLNAGANMSQLAFMLTMSQEPEFEAIANLVCLVSFVDPPLVETEQELQAAEDPNTMLVTDLTLSDRTAVFYQLQSPEPKSSEEVKQEKMQEKFRPESEADVGTDGTGDDAEAAE